MNTQVVLGVHLSSDAKELLVGFCSGEYIGWRKERVSLTMERICTAHKFSRKRTV